MNSVVFFTLALFCHAVLACTGEDCQKNLDRISLPEGFEIEYFARVNGARSIYMSTNNILYVGNWDSRSSVYAVYEENGEQIVLEVASGLWKPNGLAMVDGDLLVVELHRIIRFENIDQVILSTGSAPGYTVLREDFPREEHHGARYSIMHDYYLYVAIGSPCNTCLATDLFATIARIDYRNIATAEWEIVAHGARSVLGMAFHPVTGELWFTDNGRDNWGNNRPGDELNRITQFGQHFGFPYCYNNQLVDSNYNTNGTCDGYIPPAQVLGPHVASLGLKFYTGSMFPEKYHNGAFIAEHGSWNRDVPLGYRLTFVELNANGTAPIEGARSYQIFAEGWLPEGATVGAQAFGRPVDVWVLDDGSLLLSDDRNDAVYRITYNQ